MRVAVLGAGAMGSLVGARLAHGGHDVTLIARRPHAEAVAAHGLRVTGHTDATVHPRAVARAADASVPDLLVVTTKAYDTAAAVEDAAPILGERTVVLSLQNGLGNLEAIAKAVPRERVVGGVTTHGVTFVAPGHVHHAGVGYTVVGGFGGAREPAERAAGALRDGGLDVAVTDNVVGEVWAKVVVNAGINPLTAITGLPNGALVAHGYLREVMERACDEAVSVAHAEGVELPDDDLVLRTRRVAELTAENKSSMLQDVERGRRTEVQAISGEIVARGAALGVDTPVNLALSAMVRGIELTTRR